MRPGVGRAPGGKPGVGTDGEPGGARGDGAREGGSLAVVAGEAFRALLRRPRAALGAAAAVAVSGALAVPVFALWRPGRGGLLDPEPALRVVTTSGGLEALPLDWSPAVVPPAGIAAEGLEGLLAVLATAAGLAVATATVAVWSLLVGRTRRRGRELGIRSAVGARAGLLRAQLLVEGALVAVAGALAGGLLGGLAGTVVLASLPPELALGPDAPAWSWAGLLALGPPVLAAVMAPVAAAPGPGRGKGSWTPAGLFRSPPRIGGDLLVAGQATGLLAVLVAAGLVARAHGPGTTTRVSGFEPRDTVLLRVEDRNPERDAEAAWSRALAAARARPGTVSAAVASPEAWAGVGPRDRIVAECWCSKGGGFAPVVSGPLRHAFVGPDFFRTLRVPVLEGRSFREEDRRRERRIAVVTETFARRWLAGSGAVGKEIWVAGSGQQTPGYEIVGVVREPRPPGLTTGKPAAPVVFLPEWLHPPAEAELVVRTAGTTGDTARRLASAVERGAPGVRVSHASLLDEVVVGRAGPMRRAAAVLAGLLAGIVLLAGLGAGGLAADEARNRRAEFGLRRAVGARRGQIAGLAVGAAVRPAVAGVIVGPVLALPVAIVLDELLLGVRPADPIVWLSAAAGVAACAALGALGPARRAARDDPARALEAPWT